MPFSNDKSRIDELEKQLSERDNRIKELEGKLALVPKAELLSELRSVSRRLVDLKYRIYEEFAEGEVSEEIESCSILFENIVDCYYIFLWKIHNEFKDIGTENELNEWRDLIKEHVENGHFLDFEKAFYKIAKKEIGIEASQNKEL